MSRVLRVLERPRTVGALRVLLFAVAIVFLFQTYHRATRPIRYDYDGYLKAAAALYDGRDPYHASAEFPLIYPLFLPLALVPLAKIPYEASVVVWFALGAACLYAAAARAPRGLYLLGLLAFLDPVQITLLNGQVNPQVLLLSVLFFDLHARGRKALAAAALGTAIAIKIVPLVFLMYLARRRDVVTIALAVAAAVLLCLLPVALVGGDIVPLYERYWREFFVAHGDRAATLTPGGGHLYFTPYGLASALAPALADSRLLKLGVLAAVLGAVAFVDRAKEARTHPAAFGLYLVLIPMLSPVSEVHHLLFVLPAAVVLTHAALVDAPTPVRACAASFWLLFWGARLAREGPFYAVAVLALFAGLFLVLREASRPRADPALARAAA